MAVAPWGSPFFTLVRDHPQVFEQLPGHLHEALVRAYVASASHRGLAEDMVDQLVEPWLDAVGQAAFYRQIAQADPAHTDEIEPRYGDLDLPVHVVWGAEDTWIPVDRAHHLHDAIPGSSIRLLEDAGHLVQLDRPDVLVEELRGWLTSHSSSDGPEPVGLE